MAAMRTRITELPNQLTSSIDAADAVVGVKCASTETELHVE